jgi:hypothetical protein
MELTLSRPFKLPEYTIGKLDIDGHYFSDTLEDTVRDLTKVAKIPGKTAIPAGRYRVILSMSTRFKRIMPEILGVPGFTGIRIHNGRTAENTDGCVIVGKNKIKGGLVDSKFYFNMLMSLLQKAWADKYQRIYIEVKA